MDVSMLIISSLMGIGYYLNKNGRQRQNTITLRDNIPSSQMPNSYHIYEGNNYKNIIKDQQNRANNLNRKSQDPENTNIIPALYNLKNIKNSKKKLLVLPPLGTKQNQNKIQIAKKQLSKPNIDPVTAVYKTKPEELGGFGGITRENFHNNMTPFFSGSQPKQDMRLDSNYGGQMERMTGVGNVMYKHKSETKSFHQMNKHHNVFTTPALSDSMRARTNMIVNHKKQGELLHQPINVAPSTSGVAGVLGDDGFHPMFRETERTVDDLRTASRPKQSMDIRERVPIAKGTLSNAPLRPEFHQNNPPREHLLNLQYSVPQSASVRADRHRSNTGVFVPPNARSTLGNTGYVGNHTGVNNQQGYITKNIYNDTNTIRSQNTGEKYIGPVTGDQQHSVYDTTPQRRTIKETTQTSYVPNYGNDKGQGYRIVNQEAHVTARETTNSGYIPNAQPTTHGEFISRDNVYNSEINALKTLTEHMREPTQQREKLLSGKDSVNYQNFRSIRHVLNEQIPQYKNNQPRGKIDSYSKRPINTAGRKNSTTNNRNNNIITEQLASNPYIQKDMGLQERSNEH